MSFACEPRKRDGQRERRRREGEDDSDDGGGDQLGPHDLAGGPG